MHTKTEKILLIVFVAVAIPGLAWGMAVFLQQQERVANPLDGMSNFQLGDYYFNNDEDPSGPYDIAKAREYYTRVVEDDPQGNSLVWYQLGRIDFIEGKFDDALEKFAKQQQYFGSQVPNVYYMIGLTYGYKARHTQDPEDWSRGQEAFETFIDIVPDAPWPRVDLAWLLFLQGKYEQMKEPLAMGLAYYPSNPWLLNMYGLALLNTEEKESAATYFYKAQAQANKLTTRDWGLAYPGNDPDVWDQGLAEFRQIIQVNIDLTQ